MMGIAWRLRWFHKIYSGVEVMKFSGVEVNLKNLNFSIFSIWAQFGHILVTELNLRCFLEENSSKIYIKNR